MPSWPPSARARRLLGLVLAATAAALALRLLHVRALRDVLLGEPPFGMDRWLATLVASTVAAGDWLGGWAAPYDSSPGYSYVLAAAYAAFGEAWEGPLLLQTVLGALVPAMLAWVAWQLANPEVGVLTAFLAALYLPAIFYEPLLVKFSLIPVCSAASLVALVATRQGRRGGAVAAGVGLGLLSLLRPNTLLLAPAVAWWAACGAGRRAAIRRLLLVAAGALVVLGPMAVRDRVAAGRGRGSALAGIHFFIGSNPEADGEYVIVPGVRPDIIGHVVDARRLAERARHRTLRPEEVSRYWMARGLAFVREQPWAWARLELRKLLLVFEPAESGSFGDEFFEHRHGSPVLGLPLVTFGTVGPLGLLGLAISIRRRQWLLPLWVGFGVVGLLPFFAAARYRLPLAPAMIVAAAIGVGAIRTLAERRGWPIALLAVLGILVVGMLLGATWRDLAVLAGTTVSGALLLAGLDGGAPGPPASAIDVAEADQPLEERRVHRPAGA